jgi:hypothetical protein
MRDAGAPTAQIQSALGVTPQRFAEIAGGMIHRGLLDEKAAPTTKGLAELARGRLHVGAATASLTVGITAEQEQVCREVLETVRERAEQQLATLRAS